MKLHERVALSSRPGVITLLREGLFVRLYNQSLAKWLAQADKPLKVSVRRWYCLGNALCYSGGLPEASFLRWCQQFPSPWQWQETPWGYEATWHGAEPDWEAFVAMHPLTTGPQVTTKETVDQDVLRRLAQWDMFTTPPCETAALLAACQRILVGTAAGGSVAPIDA